MSDPDVDARAGCMNAGRVYAPASESELRQRAVALAGYTLAQLAQQLQFNLPVDTGKHKGVVGELLERALGAGGNLPQPDFVNLGIELKTLPVSGHGRVRESTHVCVLNPAELGGNWESSLVCRKLNKVLFMPIQDEAHIPLAQRQIGRAVCWQPSAEERLILRRDWEELMEWVTLGQQDSISAKLGQALQLRPKAASGSSRARAHNPAGEPSNSLPRGFYLRASFTQRILDRYFALTDYAT